VHTINMDSLQKNYLVNSIDKSNDGEDHEQYSELDTMIHHILKRKFVILFEGNIASGKTKLIENIQKLIQDHKKSDNWRMMTEFEHMGKDALDMLFKFNENPKQYALAFQELMDDHRLEVMRRQIEIKEDSNIDSITLIDTGIMRHHVFTMANFKQGNMTKEQCDSHMLNFKRKHDELNNPMPDVIFLLNPTMPIVRQNIIDRNRSNETSLSDEYLSMIKESYIESIPYFTQLYNDLSSKKEHGMHKMEQKIHVISLDENQVHADPVDIIKKIYQYTIRESYIQLN
jgi:deoxyadenosine/deoxycytidine kinase